MINLFGDFERGEYRYISSVHKKAQLFFFLSLPKMLIKSASKITYHNHRWEVGK